jgi:chitinase
MFTIKDTFAIVYSAVRSQAARSSALLVIAGLLTYAQSTAPVVVGYYLGSSASTFPVNNLVTNGSVAHLTHLNYAFADIVAKTPTGPADKSVYSCALHNSGAETGPSGIFQQLKQLKVANPNLKILISIGGALGSGDFQAASSEQYVQSFAQSCVNLFIGGQFATSTATTPGLFDGIDIDWEFPAKDSAGQPNIQYSELLENFRNQLDLYTAHNNFKERFVLTSAISPNNGNTWQAQYIFLRNGYGNSATNYVDFFNVMTYDYAGSWDTAATSTAPLSSIEANIADLIGQGAPASKLVLGVPFYGVDYQGKFSGDTSSTPLSTLLSQANASPIQIPATATTPPSTLDTDYAAILQQTLGKVNVAVQHDSYGSAWALDPTKQLLWVYDDATTLQTKGTWARGQHLGGMMTWDITKDTASGTLLCAMEAAAIGSTGSVCVSSQPAPPLFDFESGVSGWTNTGQVYSIAGSTAYADTGHNSMAVNFSSAAWSKTPGTVWIAPPAAIKAGSTVSFEVYAPNALPAALTDIQAFFMDAKWTWTSVTVNASSLKPNAWNQVSVTVPSNAVPAFTEIGLQFDWSAAWTGTIYVDSVTVH